MYLIFREKPSRKWSQTEMGSVTMPTIRSEMARLTTKKVNGDLRRLYGSLNTARQTKKFPGTVIMARNKDRDAVMNERAVGAGTPSHEFETRAIF